MEAAPPVDVGILANQQPDNNNEDAPAPEAENHTTRWDVYESMNGASQCGNWCYSDIANGSTSSPALPPIVGLRVSGVGNVPLPISDEHAEKIKSKAIKSKTVYTIDAADNITIQHPQWDNSVEKLVATVAYKLGLDPGLLTTELEELIYMEKGSCVKRKNDVGDHDTIVGTLLIQLPSKFTGREMTVCNASLNGEDNFVESAVKSTLGAGADATYSCHFACHFSDCEYEMAKMKSGSRLLLRYSLVYEQVEEIPSANRAVERTSLLAGSLGGLSSLDRIIVVPLKDAYKPQSLANTGINALHRAHRHKAEAMKAAGKDWKLLIVNAELVQTHGYYDDTNKTSVIDIFDESGNDVTSEMSWLENVIDFVDYVHENGRDGMMLAVHNDYEYVVCSACWGECTEKSDCHYSINRKYRATFLVAYDQFFEPEVMCLGGVKNVAKVSEAVVTARDYNLLDRLMFVVEAKEKSKFNSDSCEKLIQMLMKSKKDPMLRDTLVNKVLSGLAATEEPDEQLYEAIIGAVDKFGHETLRESIEELLSHVTRKRSKDISIFLRRIDFGLQLSSRVEEGGPNYLQVAIDDLSRHGNTDSVEDSAAMVNKIMDLISSYTEHDLSNVVEACLTFLHRVRVMGVITNDKSFPLILNRAGLFVKLHRTKNKKFSFDNLQSHLVGFAADFVDQLGKVTWKAAKGILNGQYKKMFVQATIFVTCYGKKTRVDKFGKLVLRSLDFFTTFVNAVIQESDAARLCHILNKCLLQHSIVSNDKSVFSAWTVKNRNAQDVLPTPSLHIRKIFEMCPAIVELMSNTKNKRLPLHYAVASSTASYEVVMEVFNAYKHAASIRDPVTGLYPFQLAASVGNFQASHSLLLENPCVVAPSSATVKISDKKRKRSS